MRRVLNMRNDLTIDARCFISVAVLKIFLEYMHFQVELCPSLLADVLQHVGHFAR